MKDYIIWLKSGECLTGIAEEDILKKVQNEFKDNIMVNECHPIVFNDSDGIVVINADRVEAIAINKTIEAKPIGFMK